MLRLPRTPCSQLVPVRGGPTMKNEGSDGEARVEACSVSAELLPENVGTWRTACAPRTQSPPDFDLSIPQSFLCNKMVVLDRSDKVDLGSRSLGIHDLSATLFS